MQNARLLDHAESIDWEGHESYVVLPPGRSLAWSRGASIRFPDETSFPAHLWLMNSGTTGDVRFVALSKGALLSSAKAVNTHLEVVHSDIWLCALPHFHVGGLSIYARSYLSASRVESLPGKWDAHRFVQQAESAQATLTSLVPTQVFDLVQAGLRPPPSLRAVLVGGDRLSVQLYDDGRALGWPILPTYGMSEASSQIATAKLSSLACEEFPALKVLPHVAVACAEDGRISIRGPSLLSGYLTSQGFVDPCIDGWFATSDVGAIWERLGETFLHCRGRLDDVVKVRGELVSLSGLEEIVAQAVRNTKSRLRSCIVAIPHPRLGHELMLAVESIASNQEIDLLVQELKKIAPRYAQIEAVTVPAPLPLLPSGKIDKISLSTLVAFVRTHGVQAK